MMVPHKQYSACLSILRKVKRKAKPRKIFVLQSVFDLPTTAFLLFGVISNRGKEHSVQ